MAKREERARLYQDEAGEWRWRWRAANGRTIDASTQGYVDKADAVENYRHTSPEGAPELLEDLVE